MDKEVIREAVVEEIENGADAVDLICALLEKASRNKDPLEVLEGILLEISEDE
jgi:hypothetical protein